MFKHQGPSRSPRLNAILAAYLAFVAGSVNSSGFVLVGSFTSHVTGNVGRVANDVASRDADAAFGALIMIAAFFAGAFIASMIVESDVLGTVAYAYGAALAIEASLLVAFMLASAGRGGGHLLHDMEGALLCGAMGMQNSLVTRLSGAVVRTTHLTGVITDLGIEGARWFRWWRWQRVRGLGRAARVRASAVPAPRRRKDRSARDDRRCVLRRGDRRCGGRRRGTAARDARSGDRHRRGRGLCLRHRANGRVVAVGVGPSACGQALAPVCAPGG